MTNPLGISDARALLRTRAQLRSAGTSERAIDAALAAGELLRLRRDRYVDAAAYEALWSEGRHLVQTVAAAKNLDDHSAVFWGPSAAVLHGLPLYRLRPASVHTVILGGHHGRVRAGVRQHEVSLGVGDVIDIDGILCTSLDRTILDLACTVPAEAAVCAADAAQRRETVVGNESPRIAPHSGTRAWPTAPQRAGRGASGALANCSRSPTAARSCPERASAGCSCIVSGFAVCSSRCRSPVRTAIDTGWISDFRVRRCSESSTAGASTSTMIFARGVPRKRSSSMRSGVKMTCAA
ncbi:MULTISPECIES: hypothetical protein [unclassified Microbacterium]|uniref:hypothetical protein n=1 Tax=unclassified Microbacterium TaxID=2609290 RepID=UPI00301B446C